jgi:hypothetical protein
MSAMRPDGLLGGGGRRTFDRVIDQLRTRVEVVHEQALGVGVTRLGVLGDFLDDLWAFLGRQAAALTGQLVLRPAPHPCRIAGNTLGKTTVLLWACAIRSVRRLRAHGGRRVCLLRP